MIQPEPKAVKVLDCTLRDGGYYNDWDFSQMLIDQYISAMPATGVDVMEMGFRMVENGRYLGPCAYTTDRFLSTLAIPEQTTIGVMVDAKVLLSQGNAAAMVSKLFAPASSSPVGLVRIAAGFKELGSLQGAVEQLKELGYRVGVNLMQVANCDEDQIEWFGRTSAEWNADVVYVADSFGSLRPWQVRNVIRPLIDSFGGAVGCHFHDNMSYALANTMVAIDAGATWADGTVAGMGRGPGNTRIEDLILELTGEHRPDLDVVPLLRLVSGSFAKLKDLYGWGSNIFFFMSGLYGVHPTYVVELLKDQRFSSEEIVSAIRNLSHDGGRRFGDEQLTATTSGAEFASEGTFSLEGWANGREVLLVGPGPQGHDKQTDIEDYVGQYSPIVIGINADAPIKPELLDAVAVCHPLMAAIDANKISDLGCPVFAPDALIKAESLSGERLLDVGVKVEPGVFAAGESTVTIPRLLVAAYALAIAMAAGANRIFLTGFDGFSPDDPRQTEMLEVFELFARIPGAPSLVALTKTNYPIRKSSLYAPPDGE
jgi:4-hydroxy 2-oxovalerate aldolase